MSAFPTAFVENMRAQLGDKADALLEALDSQPCRGLRLNPRKQVSDEALHGLGLGAPIPWWPRYGRYLAPDSAAGAHPLHEAGAFYLQEPSAMSPVSVLAPKAGEKILDLCAAPGGKSTQIADALGGAGLLVCNEPVPSRARVLSRNLERMGVCNALVTCADPEPLSRRWPCAFDAILVDAPCSGEGMFRKTPEAREEWREGSPSGLAAQQKRILECAVMMLKPGGRLVYSTCTFNRVENDDVAAWLEQSGLGMRHEGFSLPVGGGRTLDAPSGALHLYPHELQGEGHFIALFRKTDAECGESTDFLPASRRLKAPDQALAQAWRDFASELGLTGIAPNAVLGDALLCAHDLPPLDGVKVLRAGLQLGALKGRVFAPDHALAMGLAACDACPTLALTAEQARAYQGGQALEAPESLKGWAIATYEGLALGFVKCSEGQAKNHYPKGLRRP